MRAFTPPEEDCADDFADGTVLQILYVLTETVTWEATFDPAGNASLSNATILAALSSETDFLLRAFNQRRRTQLDQPRPSESDQAVSTLNPSRLQSVENAQTFKALTQANFEILAEEIAKRVASYQNWSPTTIIGPPTIGDRVLNEFWRDALGGEWVCTAAGTPGTWKRIRPRANDNVTAAFPDQSITSSEDEAVLASPERRLSGERIRGVSRPATMQIPLSL